MGLVEVMFVSFESVTVWFLPQDRASGPLHHGWLRGQQHNGAVRPEGRLQVLRRPGGVHQGSRTQLQQVPGDPGGVYPSEELPSRWTQHNTGTFVATYSTFFFSSFPVDSLIKAKHSQKTDLNNFDFFFENWLTVKISNLLRENANCSLVPASEVCGRPAFLSFISWWMRNMFGWTKQTNIGCQIGLWEFLLLILDIL